MCLWYSTDFLHSAKSRLHSDNDRQKCLKEISFKVVEKYVGVGINLLYFLQKMISYKDFIDDFFHYDSKAKAKRSLKIKVEKKGCIEKDSDASHFHFNE